MIRAHDHGIAGDEVERGAADLQPHQERGQIVRPEGFDPGVALLRRPVQHSIVPATGGDFPFYRHIEPEDAE